MVKKQELKTEVQRIMKLHNLMKKQTILVCISMCSAILCFVGTEIEGYLYHEARWDIIIDSIYIWLMLDTSKIYWNACKM